MATVEDEKNCNDYRAFRTIKSDRLLGAEVGQFWRPINAHKSFVTTPRADTPKHAPPMSGCFWLLPDVVG